MEQLQFVGLKMLEKESIFEMVRPFHVRRSESIKMSYDFELQRLLLEFRSFAFIK